MHRHLVGSKKCFMFPFKGFLCNSDGLVCVRYEIGPELVLLHMGSIHLGHFKSCIDLERRINPVQKPNVWSRIYGAINRVLKASVSLLGLCEPMKSKMTVQLTRSCCLFGCPRNQMLVASCLEVFLGSCRHYGRDKSSALQDVHSLPPAAPRQPCVKEAHGVHWNDPYHWMSNPSQKAFLVEHLHQENKYADVVMADTLQLQQTLMREMASRMGSELSVPPERWGSWYWSL